MAYLIDTNIIIYYFNGLIDDDKIDTLLTDSFNLSVISQIEFLGWSGFSNNAALYQQAQTFISHANFYDLDASVIQKTIELRQHHKIKTPDAIIAATALVYNLGIATNNTSDFQQLDIDLMSIQTL